MPVMQAPRYNRTTDFAADEVANVGGRSTVLTAQVNAELDALGVTANALGVNQSLNQRDDGEIRDGRVKTFALASDVRALLTQYQSVPRGPWVTMTAYALKDLVAPSGVTGPTYIAIVAHTSAAAFATDLAAGKWLLFSLGVAPSASQVTFTPTATVDATNMQDALAEVDGELRTLVAGALTSANSTSTSLVSALEAAIASSTGGQGASMVGVHDASDYFTSSVLETVLAELSNGKNQFQTTGVNVLRYIPPAEWPAILNYTSTTDLKTYLQAALTAEPHLIFPDGRFSTSAKLIPRVDATIRGINRRATQLRAIAAVSILEYPIDNVDCEIENIYFTASVTGATGITAAATGGANHDYLIRPHIKGCDFAWELAYGVNADLIYSTIDKSTFGYYGTLGSKPAPGASSMVAIRSHSVTNGTTNLPNLNRVSDCNISAGSLTQAAVDIDSGTGWHFHNVDFSFGGQALATSNVSICKFTGSCWLEGNVATNQIIDIGACLVPVDFDGVNFTNNTAPRIIRYPSSVASLSIKRCLFGFPGAAGFPIFDSVGVSSLLPANGCVEWYSNYVSGGDAGNKTVTGTEFRGGRTSPRFTAIFDTTGSASIVASSDPSLTIVHNGTGDVTITSAHPLGGAATTVMPVISGKGANANRAQALSATQIKCQLFTDASVAQDGIATLVVYGA